MVIVRGGGEDVSAPKQHFNFFNEMQNSIVDIFKLIGTRIGCSSQDKLRTVYIDTSKVLYAYLEKEINEGNYAFTAEEDRLFYNFYKMIGYTRSIKYGLGQRDQTYAMIMAWWNYYPECAYDAIKHMVCESSFGFWGDIKHFCYFVDKYWSEFNTHHCGHYNNRVFNQWVCTIRIKIMFTVVVMTTMMSIKFAPVFINKIAKMFNVTPKPKDDSQTICLIASYAHSG